MEVKDLKTGEVFTDEAECFVNASGLLSTPKRTSSISRTASYADQFSVPDVENLEAFKGQVLHTAEWDDSIDLNGKTVALVGAGSSSLQVLPMIQPKAKHVDQYIRSSTWVSLVYAYEETTYSSPVQVIPLFGNNTRAEFCQHRMSYIDRALT